MSDRLVTGDIQQIEHQLEIANLEIALEKAKIELNSLQHETSLPVNISRYEPAVLYDPLHVEEYALEQSIIKTEKTRETFEEATSVENFIGKEEFKDASYLVDLFEEKNKILEEKKIILDELFTEHDIKNKTNDETYILFEELDNKDIAVTSQIDDILYDIQKEKFEETLILETQNEIDLAISMLQETSIAVQQNTTNINPLLKIIVIATSILCSLMAKK